MAISNYIPSSRLAQSGVCTSTTRPASPFEGQMIYETDTNRVLVWDNAAWVMIADTDEPPGMQFIKTQTVGTAVSSVEVTGAFSADFTNYFVTWNGGTMSNDTAMMMRLGSTTTAYYGAFIHTPNYTGTTVASAGDNNNSQFTYVGGGNSTQAQASFTVLGPQLANRTYVSAGQSSYGTVFGSYSGRQESSTQFTAFTLIPFSGTMTGGTIRVYGYRN